MDDSVVGGKFAVEKWIEELNITKNHKITSRT